MNEPQPSPAAPDHLQDAKETITKLTPSVCPIERQMVLAQEALAHAVIALVERLDALTYHGFDGINRVQVFNKEDGP